MPKKKELNVSQAEKAFKLFFRLLKSPEENSLTDLAKYLNCSKQTIGELVHVIRKGTKIEVQQLSTGNRLYYYIDRHGAFPKPNFMNASELRLLYMCRDFATHLLGAKQIDEITNALLKIEFFLPESRNVNRHAFESFRPGKIDYTPYQDYLEIILEAIDRRKVCKISYKSLQHGQEYSFYIKPLKIFAHQDTIYLDARKAKTPGVKYTPPKFDPLLVIHRLTSVEITDTDFEFPPNYDFEKTFNNQFGIIKEESFQVEVELKGWAARYVSERNWSPDQKIVKKGNDIVRLKFSSSSEPEIISRLLGFGPEAKVIKPDWLVEEMKIRTRLMTELYN